MAKRKSEEARILNYFETAPIESVNIVFGLVAEKVKQRRGVSKAQPAKAKTASAKKVVEKIVSEVACGECGSKAETEASLKHVGWCSHAKGGAE